MVLWAVGAVINVIGSILINLGTNIIKLGHTRTATLAEGKLPKLLQHPQQWWRTPGKKTWLCGMLSFSIGNLLNFASFAFAAQSLLSALGVVQFISNIIFGRFVNKERVTKRVLFATAVVCSGCILLVLFGNHESPTLSTHDMLDLYSNAPYIVYLCTIFTCSPIMYFVYRHGKRAVLADRSGAAARKWARWLPISYALFAGLLGTQSVLYGKTMSMLLRTTFSGDSQFSNWYFWVSILLFLLFAGFWMSRYSKAMKLFPVLIIMPIIQIVWVLGSMISGSLYYQEYQTLNALSGSMFGLGVVILLVGVYLLTGGQAAMQQPPARAELKATLSEEERERAETMDKAALRSKAPLGDNAGVVVEVSTAAALLDAEDEAVARKLSTVYDERSWHSLASPGGGGVATGSGSLAHAGVGPGRPGSGPEGRQREGSGHGRLGGAAAAAAGAGDGGRYASSSAGHRLEEGSVSEEGTGREQLVGPGARDSTAPWHTTDGSSTGAASAAGETGRRPLKPLSEVVVSGGSEGSVSGEQQESSGGGARAGGATSPTSSLMHDLRADWGVGVRDLNAVVRASVGLPQDDPEGTAFSIWSMPMCCSSSFTTAGGGASRARSFELPASATFRIRSALEQHLGGSSGGEAGLQRLPATTDTLYPPGGAIARQLLGRPGHRRINRSHSANELDEMLRAAALMDDHPELAGAPAWRGAADVGSAAAESAGSTCPGASHSSITACGAAGATVSTGGQQQQQQQQHRHTPSSSGSAPMLTLDYLGEGGTGTGGGGGSSNSGGSGSTRTPPMTVASGNRQVHSAAGSAARQPWAAETPPGLPPGLPAAAMAPALSQASQVDESEGASGGGGSLTPRISVSGFLSSMPVSPHGSNSRMALAASQARQQAGKKGDNAS